MMAVVVIFLFVIPVFCAEIDGQWTGVVNDQYGKKLEFRYRFRAEGSALIGLIESRLGTSLISEGKIDGNIIEFKLPGKDYVIINNGTLSGDEIHLMEIIGTEKIEVILKRVKELFINNIYIIGLIA